MARLAAANLNSGKKGMALTFGCTIHLHNTPKAAFLADRNWLCHELKHVEQFRRYGIFPFIFLYLFESLRKGYYNNRFEQEARQAANDRALLDKVIFI